MKNQTIHIDNFVTPLGTITLRIKVNGTSGHILNSKPDSIISLDTLNHSIEIIPFNDVKEWTSGTDFPVEDSKGWIIRITKKTDDYEGLEIFCKLSPKDSSVSSYVDSGEHLDSVWIENNTHFLSIGTEDGEVMNHRAASVDYMPRRFEKELGYHSKEYSFTNYLGFGFQTKVPQIFKQEKIYFHYLTAFNPRKKSKDYPDEDDISTNFAVDFLKHTLINKLGLNE